MAEIFLQNSHWNSVYGCCSSLEVTGDGQLRITCEDLGDEAPARGFDRHRGEQPLQRSNFGGQTASYFHLSRHIALDEAFCGDSNRCVPALPHKQHGKHILDISPVQFPMTVHGHHHHNVEFANSKHSTQKRGTSSGFLFRGYLLFGLGREYECSVLQLPLLSPCSFQRSRFGHTVAQLYDTSHNYTYRERIYYRQVDSN